MPRPVSGDCELQVWPGAESPSWGEGEGLLWLLVQGGGSHTFVKSPIINFLIFTPPEWALFPQHLPNTQ